MGPASALAMARKRGYDLVEVSPGANPPVCKIMDYGKYRYRQEKQATKKRVSHLKEMKFTIKIEKHDFETKMRHIQKFLEKGDKVRASIFFRGREIVHKDQGEKLLRNVAEKVSDIAKIDQQPKLKGKVMQMLLVAESQK